MGMSRYQLSQGHEYGVSGLGFLGGIGQALSLYMGAKKQFHETAWQDPAYVTDELRAALGKVNQSLQEWSGLSQAEKVHMAKHVSGSFSAHAFQLRRQIEQRLKALSGLSGLWGEDCDAVAREEYNKCRLQYTGSTGHPAQECTERSRAAGDACRARQAGTAAPTPGEATSQPLGPAGPVEVTITTRTDPMMFRFEMPAPTFYAPYPEALPDTPQRPVEVAPPTGGGGGGVVYQYLPPNGASEDYQPEAPEPVPVREALPEAPGTPAPWILGLAALLFLSQ